ncbi:hypothetical protein JXB02_02935 [Candidatus Woesearchaeota archaeon]|nr:hypothetical protein [Candidatus Woesearchaeota archaeon]
MAAFEKEFQDFIIQVFRSFGMDMLGAKLVGVLFLEPGEISIHELAERTGYSLASVSSKLKLFESIGQVQRTKRPGSKKVYYHIESDLPTLLRSKMDAFTAHFIEPAKRTIPPIIESARKAKLTDIERKKLQIITDYYTQLMRFDAIMKEMQAKIERM